MAARERLKEDIKPKKFFRGLEIVEGNLKVKREEAASEKESLEIEAEIKEIEAELLGAMAAVMNSLGRIYADGANLPKEYSLYAPTVSDTYAVNSFPDADFRKRMARLSLLATRSKDPQAKEALKQIKGYIDNTKKLIKRVKYLLGKA